MINSYWFIQIIIVQTSSSKFIFLLLISFIIYWYPPTNSPSTKIIGIVFQLCFFWSSNNSADPSSVSTSIHVRGMFLPLRKFLAFIQKTQYYAPYMRILFIAIIYYYEEEKKSSLAGAREGVKGAIKEDIMNFGRFCYWKIR